MKPDRQATGRWGERLAASYLSQRGYTILERNARTPYGEIDLVACLPKESGLLCGGQAITVFVEVKTRASTAFGMPEEAVTPKKRQHLLAASNAYIQAHPNLESDWRIDVIAIRRSKGGEPPEIIHFENAVTGE